MYDKVVKRLIDLVLSCIGIVVLAIPMLVIAIVIKVDDPGPVFFKQNRIKKGKGTFPLLKYRSMKMSTPHDMPTHMLSNPEQYITKVGAFLRKSSLDELPQLFNILVGQMAIIGPRPALWNQDDLIAERDKYGANDIRPGLTGWAQINGRDAIEIEDKARLDGYYTEQLRKGGWTAFRMDLKCFFGTIGSVLRREGVVEGGTGELNKEKEMASKE